MKNQYFGDNRDLFKYDLILQVIQGGLINHFTYIPMLTGNDGTAQGGETNRDKAQAGTENKELMSFLDECVNGDRRNIDQLKSLFAKHAIETTIYRGKDEYFSHERREEYFREIDGNLLSKSLIFVDPDKGLQVEKTRDKHIKYSEVENLYRRMDKDSILMVYQHFPRVNHMEYLNKRMEELKENIMGDFPVCIDDNINILFFLTKDEALEHSLLHVIGHYKEHYS
jgi:hypothetical protein